MNRRIFLQVTAPALVIGLLLFGACAASAWYINRLQSNLGKILSQNVISLVAAQELEIKVRQLRFHSFLNLMDPEHADREPIEKDYRGFEEALKQANQSAHSQKEKEYLKLIIDRYKGYKAELTQIPAAGAPGGKRLNFQQLARAHPINNVVQPCQDLLQFNKEEMELKSRESEEVSRQARLAMLILGLGGPVGGLIIGFGVARGLSRSIYQLSVRVQDMAQRLDQDVASVSIAADGDIHNLDKQLDHVVRRVEEVAERLQRHQRDMLRAEQLSAVGQLAASVAHEVRNPLTSVNMLVESALRSRNRKPLTVEDLEVIHGEIARLEQTVQGFLDFARPPTLHKNLVPPGEVVAQALDLVRVRARQQQVELSVRRQDEVMPVSADRSQLCNVLVNLFLNALDAMPHGGRLEVSLEACGQTGVRITVTDTGGGIPAEILPRLFTPFASSKPTGTGLGLSICRRIIEEHGGRITGGNRVGAGACFAITLPTTGPAV
jgi:two-component system, NtrC family, sensor histidine kinase HydH